MTFAGKTRGCSVYLIGVINDGKHYMQCCGCEFTPQRYIDGDELRRFYPWAADLYGGLMIYAEPFPEFATKAEMITHLESHQLAGHFVPDYVFHRVSATDYLEE